jgi:hypothetical protein
MQRWLSYRREIVELFAGKFVSGLLGCLLVRGVTGTSWIFDQVFRHGLRPPAFTYRDAALTGPSCASSQSSTVLTVWLRC